MKEKLKIFIENIKGQFVEISDKGNIYQCLDLAYAYIFTLGIPKASIQRLYAFQVFTAPNDLTKKYFELFVNTPEFVPNAGDLAVWDNSVGIAGHIAVCTGNGDTKTFEVFEQNNPLGSYATVRYRNYTGVIGFLRPKQPDTIPVLKSDFEGMRTKCDKYDALVALGYGSKEEIEKLIQSLNLCKANTKDIIANNEKLLIDAKTDKEKAILDLRSELEKKYKDDLLAVESKLTDELETKELEILALQRDVELANQAVKEFSKLKWSQIIDIIISKLRNE